MSNTSVFSSVPTDLGDLGDLGDAILHQFSAKSRLRGRFRRLDVEHDYFHNCNDCSLKPALAGVFQFLQIAEYCRCRGYVGGFAAGRRVRKVANGAGSIGWGAIAGIAESN